RQYLTCPTLFKQLSRNFRRQSAPRDLLPDHEATPRLLAALPARAAVGPGILLDDLARLGPAARAGTELDPDRAELLLVERRDLLDDLVGEAGDVRHEGAAVGIPVLDLGQPVLPVAGQLGRGDLVLLEHRDHLEPLRRRLQVLADALDVLPPDQRLD